MLLRYLFARRTASSADVDLSFQSRGAEVSRLEGFSDAVFGFAITLLVISVNAPATSVELMAMSHSVLPFIASFLLLFGLWRAQFNFFRRFGLEDRRTVTLTGALLLLVLLAVYPVKFLFTFILDVLPVALLRQDDSMKAMMPLANVPKVLLLYAVGFTGIALIFSRLYHHAASRHEAIGLSELELFDTRAIQRRWLAMAIGGATLAAWCTALIAIGQTAKSGDFAWTLGYGLGLPVIAAVNVTQRLAIRRLARQRLTLVRQP